MIMLVNSSFPSPLFLQRPNRVSTDYMRSFTQLSVPPILTALTAKPPWHGPRGENILAEKLDKIESAFSSPCYAISYRMAQSGNKNSPKGK